MSKKLLDAIAERKAAGFSDDDVYDHDENSDMRHVLKMKGGDIAICKAVISAKYRDRYQALYDRQFASCKG